MTKQLAKGMTMLALILTLALATAVVSASAQSRMAVADVPFEFVAGNKALAAGHYRISNATGGGEVLKITATEKGNALFGLTTPIIGNAPAEQSMLVFRRYGSRYFLSEIWVTGEVVGRKLHKSREEKKLERELASIPSKNRLAQDSYERVEIALVRQ